MDKGFKIFADKINDTLDIDVALEKGAGAAGGVGAGMMAFVNAKLISGAEIIKDIT